MERTNEAGVDVQPPSLAGKLTPMHTQGTGPSIMYTSHAGGMLILFCDSTYQMLRAPGKGIRNEYWIAGWLLLEETRQVETIARMADVHELEDILGGYLVNMKDCALINNTGIFNICSVHRWDEFFY